jgi:hypothetical protein
MEKPRRPMVSPRELSTKYRRRWVRPLTLVAILWWSIVACDTIVLDPPLPEGDPIDIVAQASIAAAYAEFDRPAGATLVAVLPLRPGLLIRASSDATRIRIAWVGEAAAAGPQVRVQLSRTLDGSTPPVFVTQATYATSTAPLVSAGVLQWQETTAAPVLDAPLSVPSVAHTSAKLRPSFADHPLGDLDGDVALTVRDALVLLDRMRSGGWTDFQRYHGDLDADDVSDAADVQRLLDKLVDPNLPAGLHVKPRELSFVELDPATDRDGLVLVANVGRTALSMSWKVPAGVVVANVGGIVNQSAALRLTLPTSNRVGWRPGFLEVSGAGAVERVRVGHLVLLVAGQSNASGRGAGGAQFPHGADPRVRLFGNDYRWRNASEPHDTATDQVDSISRDGSASYSFATRLGELLVGASGFRTYLIPAALGGSSVNVGWRPGTDPLARSTLLGSANFRGLVSAGLRSNPVGGQPYPSEGGPVTAIVWYQGESDEDASRRSVFISRTNEVMNAFASELGAPTVYVQLASNCLVQKHVQQHAVSELQRKMEAGSGNAAARANFHMVVAFDLPRSDCIHLSAYGQRVLAERIDLAIRQHVLGDSVDGTGPRLVSIGHVGGSTVVTVRTTRPLSTDVLNRALFTLFDGAPVGDLDSSTDFAGYGTNTIDISSVVRDPADPTAVRITLARAPAATPHVRYMAVAGLGPNSGNTTPSQPELWEIVASGTVRAADGGLPLPTFGPLPANAGP